MFVDLHTHLIPQVDDGPSSIDETVDMLRVAHAKGTREIVATPHMYREPYHNGSSEAMKHKFSRMLNELEMRRRFCDDCRFLGELEIRLGAEHYIAPKFLQALDCGEVLTLNGSRYLLIEVPDGMHADFIGIAARRILHKGLTPIFAHAERWQRMGTALTTMERLVSLGCLIQVNAASIVSKSKVGRVCHRLLETGMVHIVASDGHRAHSRLPSVRDAFGHLVQCFPVELVKRWMQTNPAAVLKNQPLDAETSSAPKGSSQKRGFASLLFGG